MDLKLNILVAYPYFNKRILEIVQRPEIRCLIDSGAFTAWKAGKTIEVEQYCDFIQALPFKPWKYFALDVVGDWRATMANYDHMRKVGLDPIPVFTRGAPVDLVEELYKTTDFIGVGGLVGTRGNKGFVKGIMEVVGSRKVHWLGFARDDFVQYYKPFSVDCVTWLNPERYGNVILYGKNGKYFFGTKRTKFHKVPDAMYWRIMREFQEDPLLLMKAEHWKGKYSRPITCKSWTCRMLELQMSKSTQLFMACSNWSEINSFAQAWDFWRENY